MDEITLINILNKICEKNPNLTWKLECKYNDQNEKAIMQTKILDRVLGKISGNIVFHMDSGKVLSGRYKGMLPFRKASLLTDALLEILHYETSLKLTSVN